MAKKRNNTVDVARLFSVIIVVIFHGFNFGAVRTQNGFDLALLAPPRWMFWLTWLLMPMPAFFVCGGFANALISDKARNRENGFTHYLADRGRRLTGGLAIFVGVFAVLSTVVALVWDVNTAITLSRSLMFLLWFISVYLVIVLVAPFMVKLHDRFGAWVLVVMVIGIILVDRQTFTGASETIGQLNMFLVWPLCHQLGIGYARGWFRSGPAWKTWLTFCGGIASIVILIFEFGYPESAVAFANIPLANHLPPTLAMAALGVVQASGMGLFERSGLLDTLPEPLSNAVGKLNAMAMTVYLWHVPCIIAGGAGLAGLAILFPEMTDLLLSRPMVVVASWPVIALAVPFFASIEYRLIPPLGVSQNRTLALIAFTLTVAGSLIVWRNGSIIHPSAILATSGVFAVLIGQLIMARATRPAGVQRDHQDVLKPHRHKTKPGSAEKDRP